MAELGTARAALAAAGLPAPDRDAFAHPLVADAISDALAPAERDRLHRDGARTLLELGGPAEHLAGNALRSRPQSDPHLSRLLRRAARRASRRGAPEHGRRVPRTRARRASPGRRPRRAAGVAGDRHVRRRPARRSPPAARGAARARRRRDPDRRADPPGGAQRAPKARTAEYSSASRPSWRGERGLPAADDARGRRARRADRSAGRHAERAWRGLGRGSDHRDRPCPARVGLAHRAWLETEQGSSRRRPVRRD